MIKKRKEVNEKMSQQEERNNFRYAKIVSSGKKACRFIEEEEPREMCYNIGKKRPKTFVDYDYLCDKHYKICRKLLK